METHKHKSFKFVVLHSVKVKAFISIHPDIQSPITVAPLHLLLVPHLVSRLFLLLIHPSCLRFLPLFLRCLFLGQIVFHSCGRRRLIQNLSRSLPLWWRLLCNKESELCPLVYSTHSVSSFSWFLEERSSSLHQQFDQKYFTELGNACCPLFNGTQSLRDQTLVFR